MPNKKHLTGSRLLAVATLLSLTGCGVNHPNINEEVIPLSSWRPVIWHPPLQAERVELSHRVAFAEDALDLSREQRRNLADFLRQASVNQRDEVIVFAPQSQDGVIDPTDLARLELVLGELRGLGLRVSEGAGEVTPSANSIGIAVRRAVVMQPDCTPEDPGTTGSRPEHQVGCSTAYNFGAMVAYPEDVIEGRGLSPADGTKAATSIERYRTDEVKKLLDERTSDL